MGKINIKEPFYGGAKAYNTVAKMQRIIDNSVEPVDFNIQYNGRVGLPAMFMLGTLPIYGKSKNKVIRLNVPHKMYVILSRINVIDYYKIKNQKVEIDVEKLLQKPAFRDIRNSNDIIQFINELSMEVPLKISDEMSAMLTSRIGEIFLNALEHAGANMVIGGKYYRNSKNRYCFTCYDNGHGIIQKVQEYNLKNGVELTEEEAIKWALKPGNSTSNEDISRGIGLSMLKEFAINNGFSVRICNSHTLYVLNGKNGQEKILKIKESFKGTLFEVNIVA